MAGTDRAVITSSKAPQPLGAYSMAMSVSPRKLIYIAGQVSVDSSGSLVGKGNVVAQTRQALKNIGHVLAAAGASFSDVVEFTTYVVGRPSVQGYIQGRSEVYPEMYPDSDFPPNTLLVVAGLVDEDFLVEIKAVAALH
ncbi:MAG: RidA family protein [Chloroflexota bacterium]|nr:RidA family protein [Chloroflexota bacterium]